MLPGGEQERIEAKSQLAVAQEPAAPFYLSSDGGNLCAIGGHDQAFRGNVAVKVETHMVADLGIEGGQVMAGTQAHGRVPAQKYMILAPVCLQAMYCSLCVLRDG